MIVEELAHESSHTGRSMRVRIFGERGLPLIYLPTSGGDETEFERYGMHHVCAPWIDAGVVRLASIDAGGPRSLFDVDKPPRDRLHTYVAYERYALHEMLPWWLDRTRSDVTGLIGASYGAYMAANVWLKVPERIQFVCGLGGVYEMLHRLDGYRDELVTPHTPLEQLPAIDDERLLATLRDHEGVWMYAARDDPWLKSSHDMAWLMGERQVPHRLEEWPSPADHHESWWCQQLRVFLERRFGPARVDGGAG